MDPKRRMIVLKMIVLAAEEMHERRSPDLMLPILAKQYGARFEITTDEVDAVLSMTVRDAVSHNY